VRGYVRMRIRVNGMEFCTVEYVHVSRIEQKESYTGKAKYLSKSDS
jgi:hypothetical protein